MVATIKKPVMTDLKGQTLLTLRSLNEENPASLETYIKLGGYAQLKRIVTEKVKATDIITQIKTSNLRGRGGAGFPTGLKWSLCRVITMAQNIWFVIVMKASQAHLKTAILFATIRTS